MTHVGQEGEGEADIEVGGDDRRPPHPSVRRISGPLALKLLLFTISSVSITVYRLAFDCVNVVYLVHSIVIFADLTLANVLSRSILFNLSLNLVAIICTLLYKCFGLLLIELVETTLMAVFASLLELYIKFRAEVHNEPLHNYNLHKKGQTPVTFLIEEFLDGAAGIMYTSFVGLVFAEIAGLLIDQKAPVYCLWDSRLLPGCPL